MTDLSSELLLLPTPALAEWTGGVFTLPTAMTVSTESVTPQDAVCMHELGARPARAATVRLRDVAGAPRKLAAHAMRPEGYALVIGADGVDIWASTGVGRLYAVMTLKQLIRQFSRKLPCLAIGDSPRLARRGIQLCFPQGHTAYRHAYMKDLVPQLARLKLNELYLYLESYFDFPSLPHMAGPEAMTPADARDLDRLCRAYGITLIPMLNVLAHSGEILATQRYAHLREYKPSADQRTTRPFNLCATSKETEKLVDGMIGDLCDCFSADIFHIGGDEVGCLGECPRCTAHGRQDKLPLYLKYFNRVLDRLAKNGKRGGIWGDMLLHYAPTLSSSECNKVFAGLRGRAVIYDWQYEGGSPKTLAYFAKAKLDTIACSSTHLCYSAAMWPSQAARQKALFLDAMNVKALGGMTTAWGNFTGLHEEQFNYLHATGAGILWSGAQDGRLAGALSPEQFDTVYSLQRYGLTTSAFTDYLHAVGDANGPILRLMQPQHGLALRKCLYHTDNPLLFWDHYAHILSKGHALKQYASAVAKTRTLWNRAAAAESKHADPYFRLHEGPLVMHEHLLARYQATDATYALYDEAARVQYAKPAAFRKLLDRAAQALRAHRKDFAPVDAYLAFGRKTVGFDRNTLNRVEATKERITYLADYLVHLKHSHRPLPAFHELHLMLLTQMETAWYGDREHEWAAEAPRFRRYTVTTRSICNSVAANANRELFRHASNTSDFVSGWKLSPLCKSANWTKPPRAKSSWKTINTDSIGFVSLHDIHPSAKGMVYLHKRFRVDADGAWLIQLGHDGGACVFVDGKPVLTETACLNPARPGRSNARVALTKGVHDVTIAFDLCGGNGWGFFFQWSLTKKAGKQPAAFPVPMP